MAVLGSVGPIALAGPHWVFAFAVQSAVLWLLAARMRSGFLLVYAGIIQLCSVLALLLTGDDLRAGSWQGVALPAVAGALVTIGVLLAGHVVQSWRFAVSSPVWLRVFVAKVLDISAIIVVVLPVLMLAVIGTLGPAGALPDWQIITVVGLPILAWVLMTMQEKRKKSRWAKFRFFGLLSRVGWTGLPQPQVRRVTAAVVLIAAAAAAVAQVGMYGPPALRIAETAGNAPMMPFWNLMLLWQVAVLAMWSTWFALGSDRVGRQRFSLALFPQRVLLTLLAGVLHLQMFYGQFSPSFAWIFPTLTNVQAGAALVYTALAACFVRVPAARFALMSLLVAVVCATASVAGSAASTAVLPFGIAVGWLVAVACIALPLALWVQHQRVYGQEAASDVIGRDLSTQLVRQVGSVAPIVGVLAFFVVLAVDVQRRVTPTAGSWEFTHPVIVTTSLVLPLFVLGCLALTARAQAWCAARLPMLPMQRISRSFGIVCVLVVAGIAGVVAAAGYLTDQAPARVVAHPVFLLVLLHIASALTLMRWFRPQWLRWSVVASTWLLFTAETAHAAAVLSPAAHLRLLPMSGVWSLLAVIYMIIGFSARMRGLRLAAMALFGLTLAKLAIFDLSYLAGLARISSFFIAGLLLLGSSWLYQLLERRFGTRRDDTVEDDET